MSKEKSSGTMLPSIEGHEAMTERPNLLPDAPPVPHGCAPDTGDLPPMYDREGVPFVGAVVDKRRREFRHYRQAVADYCADCGGADGMSRMELDIARRLAGVNTLCERWRPPLWPAKRSTSAST